jgi:hypothetical protein
MLMYSVNLCFLVVLHKAGFTHSYLQRGVSDFCISNGSTYGLVLNIAINVLF